MSHRGFTMSNKENWLEKSFLMYFRYYDADGNIQRRLELFGKQLIGIQHENWRWTSGFSLSLFDLGYIQDREPKSEVDDLSRYKSFPLLRKLIGSRKTHEEPYTETAYVTHVDDKKYVITQYGRWSVYARLPWFAIKDSKIRVFGITSPDDGDIPTFTFSAKEWEERTPSPEEVVAQAHVMKQMIDDLGKDLNSCGYDKQTNDKQ